MPACGLCGDGGGRQCARYPRKRAFPASFGNARLGWTLGGGFEYMLTGNWTVRGEYLYYKFEGDTATAPIVSLLLPFTSDATYTFDDLDLHVVRLGVNYKF